MKLDRAKEILKAIKKLKVTVYGDFCLDAYWMLDPRGSEVSMETGLKGAAVGEHKYSFGGASNVVANLAALEPQHIRLLGVVGNDIFGRELLRQLRALSANTKGMIVQKESFDTVVYCKRYLEDNEQPRIDFGIYNRRDEKTDRKLLKLMRDSLAETDILILNQQVPDSITNEFFIDGVNALINEFPDKIVILESRHYGQYFRNVCRIIDDNTAAGLSNVEILASKRLPLPEVKRVVDNLYLQSYKPVFSSRGPQGIIVRDEKGFHEVPGIQVLSKTDSVGAGDTILSALSCCLAAGIEPFEAAQFANFALTITVQKLYQTGTASPGEIIEIASDPDYIYQPELAEDIRQARYHNSDEIELCCDTESLSLGEVKHAVFDHDGTVSVLRQGWEAVMEQVMMKSILGNQYESADESLYHKVRNRSLDYIDKSTGIQTILQMEALVNIVKEFRIVPEDKILDKFGYKAVFNEALLKIVNKRLQKLQSGEFDVNDYAIKGVLSFLKSLRDKGLMLYLASGTDRDDVIAEAKAMGYADLFNGGIYGSVGDVKKYSKKMVIENILRENSLQGTELICFGDGPVEIRECRKVDGIAVGVAADEIRRHGLDRDKRTRLIKAGAHFIIPDFSQQKQLFEILKL